MKTTRKLAVLVVGLCVTLFVTACAGTSSGSGAGLGNTGGAPSATSTNTPAPTATATPKPKPTAVPHMTEVYCQHLMSVAEANALMHPTTPATKIVATSSNDGGACNYEASPANFPLIIYFFKWTGPVPIPQNDIATALAQAAGASNIKVSTFTMVSGIGAQAAYVEATATEDGYSFTIHIFYVLEGPFFFDCFTYSPLSASPLGTHAQLQQCATQVDSRL